MHQLANASLAALFLIALVVTTQRFIEYRSMQTAITFVDRTFVPL
jgi:hypothetical protein